MYTVLHGGGIRPPNAATMYAAFVSRITLSRNFLSLTSTRASIAHTQNIPSHSVVDRDKFMCHAIVINAIATMVFFFRATKTETTYMRFRVTHYTRRFFALEISSNPLPMTNAYMQICWAFSNLEEFSLCLNISNALGMHW